MTALALMDPPARLRAREAGRPLGARRGAVTLEQRLNASWRSLAAGGDADCPVCHARMRLRDGAGCCDGCGAELT